MILFVAEGAGSMSAQYSSKPPASTSHICKNGGFLMGEGGTHSASFQQPEVSLRRSCHQKNALSQNGLPEKPETAPPARRPISFSFRPVSPQGRDFANLVTGRSLIQYQWLDG
jgi:hypothetical protein